MNSALVFSMDITTAWNRDADIIRKVIQLVAVEYGVRRQLLTDLLGVCTGRSSMIQLGGGKTKRYMCASSSKLRSMNRAYEYVSTSPHCCWAYHVCNAGIQALPNWRHCACTSFRNLTTVLMMELCPHPVTSWCHRHLTMVSQCDPVSLRYHGRTDLEPPVCGSSRPAQIGVPSVLGLGYGVQLFCQRTSTATTSIHITPKPSSHHLSDKQK
jgi:hypothetical protein